MENNEIKDDKLVTDIRDTNPFVSSMRLSEQMDLRKIKNTNYKLIDDKTKEVVDENIVLAEERLSDKSMFIKIYSNGLIATADLSRAGYKLLTYILHHRLTFNNDVFDLVVEDFMNEADESKSVVYSALNELLSINVIAKRYRYPNSYFINPNMFYKGERRFLKIKYKLY